MAYILSFDTSTTVCSVTLSEDRKILVTREEAGGRNHARLLTVFIEQVLKDAGISPDNLDAIAVSKGPGSYTGLRIGVSTAKGLAYSLGIPVVGIPTLKIMASGYLKTFSPGEKTLLCPMIDARRMEVFTCFYDTGLNVIRETSADIINEESYQELRRNYRLFIFGDGAPKCEEVLTGAEVHVDKEFVISSSHMPELAYEMIKNQQFEDVAYFEPFYLKDFIATTPKKKIL